MHVFQVLRSNEQLRAKQCHYAVLPRSNGVAIAEMTRCINSVLHAVDAAIMRAFACCVFLWTSCLMQTLN